MAYFWDYLLVYPLECSIIISVVVIAYVGWVKNFWWMHKPSLYTTKTGWRVRRWIGRIIRFDMYRVEESKKKENTTVMERVVEHGKMVEKERMVEKEVITWSDWKKLDNKKMFFAIYKSKKDKKVQFLIDVYISGQPERPMVLNAHDIWRIKRNSWKLFKKEVTMNRKYLQWLYKINAYVLTDVSPKQYIIKPDVFEKYLNTVIDNLDIKSSKASRVAPEIIHSSYFQSHLSLPPNEYKEEVEASERITPYIYIKEDIGDYGDYGDLGYSKEEMGEYVEGGELEEDYDTDEYEDDDE